MGGACWSSLAIAAPAPLSAMPVEFRGEWNQKLRDCGTDLNDSRLVIGPHEINFYESEGPITSIQRVSPSEVRITVSLTGEGEGPWRQTIRFRLSGDKEALSDVTRNEPFVRLRCPPAAPRRQ
jgi:hypothetical protein